MCKHDRAWEYDGVAKRIRCADCGQLVDCKLATKLFNDIAALAQRADSAEYELASGSAELRRYVAANGFTWREDESAVFNATTAIGLMAGSIAELKQQLAAERSKRTRND